MACTLPNLPHDVTHTVLCVQSSIKSSLKSLVINILKNKDLFHI